MHPRRAFAWILIPCREDLSESMWADENPLPVSLRSKDVLDHCQDPGDHRALDVEDGVPPPRAAPPVSRFFRELCCNSSLEMGWALSRFAGG
jgi:hypothetical protein